jgi:hypothetical protein
MSHQKQPDHLLLSCERTRSAEARDSLKRLLADWALAPACPLSHNSDVLRAQEEVKRHITNSLWHCQLCGKRFRAEHFLDKHLALRHPEVTDDVPRLAARTCMADLCGVVVPCLPLTSSPLPLVSYIRLQKKSLTALPDDHELAHELEHDHDDDHNVCTDKNEQAARRHVCIDMVRRCVPPGAVTELARRRLHRNLCDDAQRAECMSWSERREWREQIESGRLMPTHLVVGWVLLVGLVLCGAFAWLLRYGNIQRAKFDRAARLRRPRKVLRSQTLPGEGMTRRRIKATS